MNVRNGCLWVLVASAVVVGCGFGTSVATERDNHAIDSIWAAALTGLTGIGSLLIEGKYGQRGDSAVLTFWIGTALRSGMMILAGIVGNRGLGPSDSQCWWLWLLAAYLVVLIVETVWLVRTLDRVGVRNEERGS